MNWKVIWLVCALVCLVIDAITTPITATLKTRVNLKSLAGACLVAYLLA